MSGEKTPGANARAGEKRLDETIEETFPASDPPANTPAEGSRKAERRRDASGDTKDAKAGDDKAQKRDPHGVAPSEKAAEGEPTGAPSSDRHDTETAAGAHANRG